MRRTPGRRKEEQDEQDAQVIAEAWEEWEKGKEAVAALVMKAYANVCDSHLNEHILREVVALFLSETTVSDQKESETRRNIFPLSLFARLHSNSLVRLPTQHPLRLLL